MSGSRVGRFADLWLTQWPHLAKAEGPYYGGSCPVIFVTVGSQEPFDRLIRAVDEWAGLRARSDVFAQIGGSDLRPQHIEFTQFLEPSEFNGAMQEARSSWRTREWDRSFRRWNWESRSSSCRGAEISGNPQRPSGRDRGALRTARQNYRSRPRAGSRGEARSCPHSGQYGSNSGAGFTTADRDHPRIS